MRRISVYFHAGVSVIFFAANPGRADSLNPIGINIAGGQSSDGPEQETDQTNSVTAPTQPEPTTAGVVPIDNWNNLVIDNFTTGSTHSSSSLPTGQTPASSTMPFAGTSSSGLTDSDGNAVAGAEVTAWTGGISYSTYGSTKINNNAQLMNGYLGTKNNGTGSNNVPGSVTVSLPSGYVSAGL